MVELFLSVLDMSVSAGLVILVILIARLFLKKAPKIFSYALWAVALFRLLCPFSLESSVSVMPAVPEISAAQVNMFLPELELPAERSMSGEAWVEPVGDVPADRDAAANAPLSAPQSALVEASVGTSIDPTLWLSVLWVTGAALLGGYGIVSWLKLKRKLVGAAKLEGNVYLADHIGSPFVLGLLRPRVYLPSAISPEERHYIVLHERHHIRRGDHLVKALAFLTLCMHWFNPLVWVAFILAEKDMEMSCDEAVIGGLDESARADYSATLLAQSTGRRIIAAAPLAFGEGDTKGRIMNLAKWKPPGRWLLICATAIVCILALVLLLSPTDYAERIRVDGRVYDRQGEAVAALPEGSYALGTLSGITHRTRQQPETDFSATNLEEKYAGCTLYQSGTDPYTIYLEDYGGIYIPFVTPAAAEVMLSSPFIDQNDEGTRQEHTDLVPGMVFVSDSCVYMNPLSSYAAFGGDSGFRYILGRNGFTMEARGVDAIKIDGTEIESIGKTPEQAGSWLDQDFPWSQEDNWQDFPWTQEEWAEICANSIFFSGWPAERLGDIRCKQVESDLYLLTLDDVLYLMKLSTNPKMGTYVWSVYTLVPESVLGSAQWEFQPISSAGKPAFGFRFDMDHTEVSAVCIQSKLIDFDQDTDQGYPSDYSLDIPAGRGLYRIPVDERGEMVTEAKITFTLRNDDDYICQGTIYITGEETQDDNGLPVYTYTATLVGTGLTMSQGEGGGVISWRNP